MSRTFVRALLVSGAASLVLGSSACPSEDDSVSAACTAFAAGDWERLRFVAAKVEATAPMGWALSFLGYQATRSDGKFEMSREEAEAHLQHAFHESWAGCRATVKGFPPKGGPEYYSVAAELSDILAEQDPASASRTARRVEPVPIQSVDIRTPQAWSVHLEVVYQESRNEVRDCSGSLIGDKAVATAAHCLRTTDGDQHPETITAYIGRHYTTSGTLEYLYRCQGSRWYAQKNGDNLNNDWGMVELSDCKEKGSSLVQAKPGAVIGHYVVTSYWAATTTSKTAFSYYGYPAVDQGDTRDQLSGATFRHIARESPGICADNHFSQTFRLHAISGGSGGPLVRRVGDNPHALVGVQDRACGADEFAVFRLVGSTVHRIYSRGAVGIFPTFAKDMGGDL